MLRTLRVLLLPAALLTLLAPAFAQAVDALVPLGGKVEGFVPADGAAVAGVLLPEGAAKVALKVKIDKKSGLDFDFGIVRPDGSPLSKAEIEAAGGFVTVRTTSVAMKNLPVPETGLYEFVLRSRNGTSGDFTFQIKGKVAKGPKLSGFLNDPGEVDEIPIHVPENAFLSVKLGPSRNSGLAPALEVLTGSGRPLDLTGFTKEKKGKTRLSKLPLPFFGTYRLRVRSAGGTGGYTISVKVKAKKAKPDPARPVADAGDDAVAAPVRSVKLTGSGGTGFAWEQVSGPGVSLAGADTATLSFTTPSDSGTMAFQLVVTQGGAVSFPDTVLVEIDEPPIAVAGRSRSVAASAPVTLDGTDSFDLDSTAPLSYVWTQVSGTTVTLSGADTATASFTAPATTGILVFELVVNDGFVDSPADRVIVGVDTTRAIADAGRPVLVTLNDSVYLSGLRSIGGPAAFAWSRVDGGSASLTLARADQPVAAFSAPRTPGVFRFRLTVDGDGETADEVLVFVTRKAANTEPDADAGGIATVASGAAFQLDAGTSSDGDGDPLTYEWMQVAGADAGLTGSGDTRDGTAPSGDDVLHFQLMVHDGLKYGPPDQAAVIVGTIPAPVADAGRDISGSPGDSISPVGSGARLPPGRSVAIHEWVQLTGLDFYDVEKEDAAFNRNAPVPTISVPDGSLASLAPDRSILFGMRLGDDKGAISFVDLFTVTFEDLPPNSSPEASARATPDKVRPATSVTLMGSATDHDGDPLTYRWTQTGGPTTVSIVRADEPIANFTAPGTSGRYEFRLEVDDGTGEPNATAIASVAVTVSVAPTLSATVNPPFGPAGSTVTLDGSGTTDPDGDPVSFFWQEVAPPGGPVTITNPVAAKTTFKVLPYAGSIAARTRTFRLTVTDAVGPTSVTVTFVPNRPPVFGGLAASKTKVRYDGVDTATLSGAGLSDPDGDPVVIAWRISAGPSATGGTLTTALAATTGFTVAKPTSGNPGTGGVWTIAGAATDTIQSTPEATIRILAYPSWSKDVYPILQNTCATSACHGNVSSPTGGLYMGSASAAYSNLVNQGSNGSGNLRVKPNDHKNSYLYGQVNSGRMPKGGSKLSQDLINIIRDWIEPEHNGTPGTLSNGAENN